MLKKLFAIALLTMAGSAIACCDDELKDPSQAVRIIDASVTVAANRSDGSPLVSVMGTLHNTTAHPVSELVVEARLTDATGKVIDVLTQPVYGVVVPPGEHIAFRLQGTGATKDSLYAGVQARVTSGETQLPSPVRPAQKPESPFVAFLISWGPMLLLIAIWLLVMRKYVGKRSPQHRSLDLIAEQNTLMLRQLAAIESIAAAASRSTARETGENAS